MRRPISSHRVPLPDRWRLRLVAPGRVVRPSDLRLLCFLCLLCGLAPDTASRRALAAGEVAGADREDPRIVDAMRPERWEPMAGSPPAVASEGAVRLACRFRDGAVERGSWDLPVRLDLTRRSGVRLRVRVTDSSPVSHYSFYLRSGDGWYSAGFSPGPDGAWETVTIGKESTRIEGRPAGWSRVDRIRLSAWRGGRTDTELHLGGLEAFGAPSGVVVVRSESVAGTRPDEVRSVETFSTGIVSHLRAAGLEPALWSDLDVDTRRLRGTELVVLPHAPALPAPALRALLEFVASGRPVVGFYALPAPLLDALGLAAGPHVRSERPGQFASIRGGEDVAGFPERVNQRSWNIRSIRPRKGKSRAIAWWHDADGRRSDHPAVLLSERGAVMTHVLLSDDRPAQGRLLLALVGHFLPAAWADAAREAYRSAGRFGPFPGTAEAVRALSDPGASGPVRAEGSARRPERLSALLRLDRRAKREATSGREPWKAIETAELLRASLVDAWCRAQEPASGEERLLWCHSAFGVPGRTWDETIGLVAANGFTAVIPNMQWGGAAYHASEVLPVASEVEERGDQIEACVAACRRHGVECHVWKVNWNMGGHAPAAFVERMRREGRVQVSFDGRVNGRWLCPSHPENRRLEVESMLEVARKYPVHGLHFDYIRYPSRDGCFCPGCRDRFERERGRKVESWPGDLRGDPELRSAWLEFRRERISRVVEEVARRARSLRPGIRISAAVFRNWPIDRDSIGQDWKRWCDEGWLDFICPMDYTTDDAQFERWVARQLEWSGRVPCYPGIGLSTREDRADVAAVIGQIRIARRLGCRGFTVFHLGDVEAREVLPRCGLGITRVEAR